MNEITRMYKGIEVRIVEINDDAWFVAKDVADALGYTTTDHMMRRLDDDEQQIVDFPKTGKTSPNGARKAIIINESGLYNAIIGSHKKEAKDFKRWVTHDVLPSIRRTGTYVHPQSPELITDKNLQHIADILKSCAEIAKENSILSERNSYLSQFAPTTDYGDPNNDGVPRYQKRRGYFVSNRGADVAKRDPEKYGYQQDLFYDRLPQVLMDTFIQTAKRLSEGK